jgi:hypothetical protein
VVDIFSAVALVGLFAGAALLGRAPRCPRCGARAVRFEESEPWFGRDLFSACTWESESYAVDI